MAFHYKLESLLRLRRSIERQEELRLQSLSAILARLRAELRQLDEGRLAQRRSAQQSLTAGGAGSMLQFEVACDSAYLAARKSLQKKLAEAENQRAEQLKIYHEARKKSEILAALRERQQEAYILDFLRREQQRVDEAFLIRKYLNPSE
ncbi:MAG TPA: flagellar FliJ family protein [Terriglobales bacterium]|nr:flagellar FliJ family protein [Terriglobales bacterium]